jgi:hypothetical protein
MATTNFIKGTLGYDYKFLKSHHNNLVLLQDTITKAMVIICPGYQGRVMTSSANGMEGHSNGWINYKLIESETPTEHINAFGGEERFWLGPEGGQFSIYFAPRVKQEFKNWNVPAILDTLPFELTNSSNIEATFKATIELVNFSNTKFDAEIERTIKLLSLNETAKMLGLELTDGIKSVAYQSQNMLVNKGQKEWTPESGMLSIWMLSMLNPSSNVVIFIPFKNGSEKELGPIVNDDYFGKVPADRLKMKNGIIYFKADGKYRSKIGINPRRAMNWSGSYDTGRKALTLLYCRLPEGKTKYVNSKWEIQKDPFSGDAINAYNDGPVEDGSQMGPFYELESSSPAANLKPGEKLTHAQTIFHLEGDEAQLSKITQLIFGIELNEITAAF